MKAQEQTPSSSQTRPPAADVVRGRDLYRQRAWAAAHEALSRADRAGALAGEDLERLALAAYFIGRDGDYLEQLQRAYQTYRAEKAAALAVRAAFWLGLRLLFRGEVGRANGWFGRARRLLARQPRDCVERGYLQLAVAESQIDAGDLDAASAAATDAASVGERFAEVDVVAVGHHLLGRIRLRQGRVREGLSLLDEVMVAVTGGELSPMVTGLLYCSVIDACQEVCALERAHEWTSALAGWCGQQPEMVAFTGICGVHRAEILQLRGDWSHALDEAARATTRCLGSNSSAAGAAFYQQGEVRRLRGELAEAEAAYRSASQHGCDPQPGLSLLRLSQGRIAAAATSIRRALGATKDPFQRARLLPAYVDILLAGGGDIDEARVASGELVALAAHFSSAVLRALADHATGATELAAGNPLAGLEILRRACKAARELNLPYLAARVRALLARCCRALGDEEGSMLEASAATAAFEQLGARPHLGGIDAQPLARTAASRSRALTARELQVLRLVAAGKTNRAIATTLSLSEKTVERHVSNICTKLDVPSRTAATSYAYEHRLF
jgi:DNA-binding CsgD family transcriptional regulator